MNGATFAIMIPLLVVSCAFRQLCSSSPRQPGRPCESFAARIADGRYPLSAALTSQHLLLIGCAQLIEQLCEYRIRPPESRLVRAVAVMNLRFDVRAAMHHVVLLYNKSAP